MSLLKSWSLACATKSNSLLKYETKKGGMEGGGVIVAGGTFKCVLFIFLYSYFNFLLMGDVERVHISTYSQR